VLELVVAFAILAMATVVAYEAIGAAMARFARLDAIEPAITLAESLLAENSVDAVYEASEREGSEGRLRWKVGIAPYSSAPGSLADSVLLVVVRVRVSWGEASRPGTVELARLALARYPSRST
jgi:hypothetical protein